MSLGEKIIILRKQKGLSQEALAQQLDVARQTISNWENNITSPDLQQAKRLSSIFGVSLDEMCENDVREVLVDKVSNVERLAGIIIKIIKIGVALLCVYMVIMVVSVMLFANSRTENVTSKVETFMTCQLNDKEYSLQFGVVDEKVVDIKGDSYMINLVESSKLTSAIEIVEEVEKHFQNNGGTCL